MQYILYLVFLHEFPIPPSLPSLTLQGNHWSLEISLIQRPVTAGLKSLGDMCSDGAPDPTTKSSMFDGCMIHTYIYWHYISGWCFRTFFICPYIRNNTPYWLIFFRGVETTNQYILTLYYMNNMIYYVIVVYIMISMWYGGLKCVILWYCVIVQYFGVFRWYRKGHSLFCLAGSVAATRYAGNNLVMEQCLFIIWEYIGVCLLLPSLKEDAEYLIPYISGILPPLLGSFSTAMWIFQQCSLDFLCSAHIHTDKCLYRICAYRNESTLICNIYIHTYWGEHIYIYVQYDQINHQTIKGFSEVCVVQERRY